MRALVLLLLLIGCSRRPDSAEVDEWVAVLERKREAQRAAGDRAGAAQQTYADALVAFVSRYPSHHRARKAYEEIELEYARGLSARGQHDRAIAVYEHLLARNPEHGVARQELLRARDLRSVTRAEIDRIRPGMSLDEVREILGPPPPGWSKVRQRGRRAETSWYYPRADRRAALVFFVDARVARTEY